MLHGFASFNQTAARRQVPARLFRDEILQEWAKDEGRSHLGNLGYEGPPLVRRLVRSGALFLSLRSLLIASARLLALCKCGARADCVVRGSLGTSGGRAVLSRLIRQALFERGALRRMGSEAWKGKLLQAARRERDFRPMKNFLRLTGALVVTLAIALSSKEAHALGPVDIEVGAKVGAATNLRGGSSIRLASAPAGASASLSSGSTVGSI